MRSAVHTWTSLVSMVFVLMLCITGLLLKIVWAILDMAAILVLGSGLYLWLAQRWKGASRIAEAPGDVAPIGTAAGSPAE